MKRSTPINSWIAMFAVAVALATTSGANAEVKTPEQVYGARPNNLRQLPDGWATEKPIQLVVSFNLSSPPNSPEANAFLENWYRSIKALPDKVELGLYRQMAPDRFSYAVTLTFDNWHDFRTYEGSEAFLKYYREHWKPNVTEAEERVYVLDTDVIGTR